MFNVKNDYLKKFVNTENGFSLIELMTVMIIISILVGIAVAIYSDVSKKPAEEAHNANMRTLISAMQMALTDHGTDSFTIVNGDPVWFKDSHEKNDNNNPCWTNYLQDWPKVPQELVISGEYAVFLEDPGPSIKIKLIND